MNWQKNLRISETAFSRMTDAQQREQLTAARNRDALAKAVTTPDALTLEDFRELGGDLQLVIELCDLHLSETVAELRASSSGVCTSVERRRAVHDSEVERIAREYTATAPKVIAS